MLKIALAPMAGVTDMPFRVLCKEMGADYTATEMVSAKGLYYKNARTEELLFTVPAERPCAVQIFGSDPLIMADIAKQIGDRYPGSFFVIDINMGCPAQKIVNNGEGSALMKDICLSARIIESVVKASPLPVTVKFRKGWDDRSVNAVEFARMAEQSGAAGVTVHGRTRVQQYSGRADWGIIRDVKAALKIPVFGNGDVFCAADALRMQEETGCDGILVARGALGNPFLFREIKAALANQDIVLPTYRERIETTLRHARMQTAYKGAHGVVEMRKHVAWYIKGLPGAAQLRARVNEVQSPEELENLLRSFSGTRIQHIFCEENAGIQARNG